MGTHVANPDAFCQLAEATAELAEIGKAAPGIADTVVQRVSALRACGLHLGAFEYGARKTLDLTERYLAAFLKFEAAARDLLGERRQDNESPDDFVARVIRILSDPATAIATIERNGVAIRS